MIITFAGQKGGSGKTTCSIAVATEWYARGNRVLLVDADPQGSSRTWAEVAVEVGESVPTVIGMGASLHKPDQLPMLAKNYDVTVIDCPPRHGDIQRASLMVADVAVIPCGPSSLEAWALAETIELVSQARMIRPNLQTAILITRKISRTVIGNSARTVLVESGLPVLDTELGYRVSYQEALASGLGITQYEPRSTASSEIRSLVDELEALVGFKKKESV